MFVYQKAHVTSKKVWVAITQQTMYTISVIPFAVSCTCFASLYFHAITLSLIETIEGAHTQHEDIRAPIATSENFLPSRINPNKGKASEVDTPLFPGAPWGGGYYLYHLRFSRALHLFNSCRWHPLLFFWFFITVLKPFHVLYPVHMIQFDVSGCDCTMRLFLLRSRSCLSLFSLNGWSRKIVVSVTARACSQIFALGMHRR